MAEYIGGEVATNGTTAVTVLAAPAASTRRELISLKINNRDTATRTLTCQHDKGGTELVFAKVTLASGEIAHVPGAIVLDATNETIEVVSDATAATTEPMVFVAAFEEP